jgi:O-antigen ligase
LSLKDYRLLALLPIAGVVFFLLAPPAVTARFDSMFNMSDPTNRDRVAMLSAGRDMVRAHPLTGVGPQMVEQVYPEYRDANAVEVVVPHLHNVPLQLAAERGLPALAAWLVFVVVVVIDLFRSLKSNRHPVLPAAGLAAMAAMATAGLFEYNFGDSEFLMLLLVLLTLPFAATRTAAAPARRA